jgi:hypothetical protein
MKSFLGNHFQFGDLVVSKPFLIELLAFFPVYILNIYLLWPQINLLLFPLILFGFALFFIGLSVGKEQIKIPPAPITVNPFGNELLLSKIFLGGSIILNVVLSLLAADSLKYPQLVNNYGLFFLIPIIIIYHTTWYWIPWNVFFSSFLKIEKNIQNKGMLTENNSINDVNDKLNSTNFKKYRRTLTKNQIKTYVIINLLLFGVLLIWFLIESILIYSFGIGLWHFEIPVPGTIEPYSETIGVSGVLWVILIGDPILFLIEFFRIVNHIIPKQINTELSLLDGIQNSTDDQNRYILKSLEYL